MAGGKEGRHCLLSSSLPLLALLSVWMTLVPHYASAFYLQGTEMSYARFPKWNACINASLSFEFKTTQKPEGLMMYVDDGGRYDFFEVMHVNGRVVCVLNIVDGKDGHVHVEVGRNVNDGAWHRVEIRRNRMETTLVVDAESASRFSFGSDFHFGTQTNNSHVYLGGLPSELRRNLHSLALPSVLFRTRFKGSIRNVMYSNCSCQTTRAAMLDGVGVNLLPMEACDIDNPCKEGCVCVSTDSQAKCDCSEIECVEGLVTHYELPMDILLGATLINPSGLDAKTYGSPSLIRGLINKAIQVNGRDTWVSVAGPGHRYECFGDLSLCPRGYTLSLWINFANPCDSETVYLSNGAHSEKGHGVAMLYHRGVLEFRFRKKNGQEWRAEYDNVLPGRWYHVAAAWSLKDGLALYINGDLVDTTISPTMRSPGAIDEDYEYNEFYLGRPNDDTPRQKSCTILVDDFNFWSMLKTPDEIRESGPFYCYDMSMDDVKGDKLQNTKLKEATVHGSPSYTEGKIGSALSFDGRQKYIDGGDQSVTCLGDTKICKYGLTVSFWVKFSKTSDNMYVMDSGNKGFKIYTQGDMAVAEVSSEIQTNTDDVKEGTWKVEWPMPDDGRWYFIELTWNKHGGLTVYQDLKMVGTAGLVSSTADELPEGDSRLYVGRANTDMRAEKYLNAELDEVQLCYGDRNTLVHFGFIPRDNVEHLQIPFEEEEFNMVVHPSLKIPLHNGARLEPGRIGNGLSMDGQGEYADLGSHPDDCMGNLERCKNGLTVTFYVNPNKLVDNGYFLSTDMYSVYQENGRTKAKFSLPTQTWEVDTNQLKEGKWQRVDLSWDPEEGLIMLIDNQKVAMDKSPESHSPKRFSDYTIYVGRPSNSNTNGVYADAMIDEMEFWHAYWDHLNAFGLINTDLPPTVSTPYTPPEIFPTAPANKMLIFDGQSWIVYDFSELPEEYLKKNNYEKFHIKFKTEEPDGLLWYSGNDQRNMHLSIKNGIPVLVVDYRQGEDIQKVRVRPPSGTVADNEWHDVIIIRDENQVILKLDDQEFPIQMNGEADIVNPGTVYLGGSEDPDELTDLHIGKNFIGYVQEAVMSGNTLPADLDLLGLRLREPEPYFIHVDGNVPITDLIDEPTKKASGITFTRPEAYLRMPKWDFESQGELAVKFKTHEPNGLLMYNGPQPGMRDFVALEMYDGVPYFVIDLGDGVNRYPFTTSLSRKMMPLNDGEPHELKIWRYNRNLRLTTDNVTLEYKIPSRQDDLDLGTFLYVGGIDTTNRLPWHMYNRKAPANFVGCIWDLSINKRPVDLGDFIKSQIVPGVEVGCEEPDLKCVNLPCVHGTCADLWTGFDCDCADTDYVGKTCEKEAKKVGFDGTDFVRINLTPTLVSHTNDISLRFKTPNEDGLLFSTSNQLTKDYLRLSLKDSKGRLETNLGGQEKVLEFCENLNDDKWHTLHIKRRANYIEAWVDNCEPVISEIPGEGYTLDIDEVLVAAMGRDADPEDSFVGLMQNFILNGYNFFELLGPDQLPSGIRIENTGKEITGEDSSVPMYPVTFRARTNSFSSLPTLPITGQTALQFMFKTTQPDGLIFYNKGRGSDYFSVELVDGKLLVSLDDGSGPVVQTASATGGRLDDDTWHSVVIRQLTNHEYEIKVDNEPTTIALRLTPQKLDLTDLLFVGGVNDDMYSGLPPLVSSRKSFSGCLASVKINGKLFNILTEGIIKNQFISSGCTNATTFCAADSCSHFGYCIEGVNSFMCDCNMTSFVGRVCTQEAEGYRFGKDNGQGIVIYNFKNPQDTDMDKLAFGFMTWDSNGTLVRIDSGISSDYIEIKLVDGHVVATYDVGDGKQTLIESRKKFNNGQYHYVTFVRDQGSATLRVDEFPAKSATVTATASGKHFNEQAVIKLGGNKDFDGKLINLFNGILAGVYLNGYRIIDMGVIDKNAAVKREGDITVATHLFHLPRPSITPVVSPIPPIVKTDPPINVLPPVDKPDPPVDIPNEIPIVNGGGVAWQPVGPNEEGIAVVVQPGGGGAGVEGGAGGPVAGAIVGSAVLPPGIAGIAEGGRAAAAAGTMIGLLVLASSLMWAMYKFKPGLLGGGGGGGAGPMSISAPRATTNYALVKSQTGSLGTGYRGGGGGGSASNTLTMNSVKVEANGTAYGIYAANTAEAGTQTTGLLVPSMYSDYPSLAASGAYSNMGIVSGIMMGGDGGITRSAQTDMAYFAGASSANGVAAGASHLQSSSHVHSESHIQSYTEYQRSMGMGGGAIAGSKSVASIETQTMPDEPTAETPLLLDNSPIVARSASGHSRGYSEDQADSLAFANMMSSSSYSYNESRAYNSMNESSHVSRSRQRTVTPDPYQDQNYNMQIQNMQLNYANQNGGVQNLWAGSSSASQSQSGSVSQGVMMASEEIRVDCVLLTNDGRHVVTGSIFGPPQVWDLKTGDLVRIMAGEDLSSTDLHLACNDTLLVGQVAEITQVDPNDNLATSRVHHRKLQIWDFENAQPLEMARNELTTASCIMADGERVALGRTEKFGNGTSIVIYDLLGNEPVRTLKYDAAIGFADYISYLTLSKDNRYVIAGFQNSYDGNANFIVFDLTVDDYSGIEPKILALDAQADCTAVLDNHEAVTGTRKGELTIWSMRTGKANRKLVSPPTHAHATHSANKLGMNAHNKEVKSVVVSKNGRYLVSASADTTLKVWDLETERLMYTLTGHTDEVWCCCISNDSDLLVSGSRDHTIRLWRLQTGQQISSFNTGVDVFSVKMSSDKKTIVALGDRFHTRKLIMLRVVVTKVRSRTGSRATSPATGHASPRTLSPGHTSPRGVSPRAMSPASSHTSYTSHHQEYHLQGGGGGGYMHY